MMGRTHHLAEATGTPAGGFAMPAGSASSRRPRRVLPRGVAFLGVALILAAGTYAAPIVHDAVFGSAAQAPTKDLLALPGQATGADGRLPLAERISFWVKRVAEQPSDDLSWLQLAASYSEQGRLRVDLDAYARALAAANRALDIAPKYPPALAVRGSIEFAIHDFSAAEADARAALEHNPGDPIARAILGDTVLELGRLDEAAAAYDALSTVAAGPTLDIRRARLAYATGDPDRAVELARKALQSASGGGVDGAESDDPILLAFHNAALAEYARLAGDADTARDGFAAALRIRPEDLAALVGLARVEAYDGDLADAIAHLDAAAEIAPTPEIEALLGDLHVVRGDARAAATAYDTVRLTRQLSALAGDVFDRQLVMFELDHGGADETQLEAARAAFAARPDAVGHDVMAWALHRLGRDDEAWDESLAARSGGITDARILFHAGAIALARGDAAAGGTLLRRALGLGPALDPADRAEAQALLSGA